MALGLSAASIALYTVLIGASASVVRAALTGGLSLFGRTVGRRQDSLNSLATLLALTFTFLIPSEADLIA